MKAVSHNKLHKIYISILLLSLWAHHSTLAIEKPVLRHVQGFSGLETRAGVSLKGLCGGIDYSYHLSRNWQIKLGLGASQEERDRPRASLYSVLVQPTLSYTVYDIRDRCYFNILGGGIIAYETLTRFTTRKRATTNFNVGMLVGLEIEYFIMDSIAIIMNMAPKVLFLGQGDAALNATVEAGLKFIF